MSASLKRRRTSQDTYVAINDSDGHDHVSTNTPTPKRASYLSPTKASLARSNPQLLEHSASAKKTRESEPNRRQSLLDAVLGNRSLLPANGDQGRQDQQDVTSTETGMTSSTISGFQKPADSQTLEKENEAPNTPPNRHSEQQNRRNSTPRRTGRSARFASPKIVPQLVDSPRRPSRRSASAEMELPPTPVQLGKDKLPDRPRGLSSSSPGGRNKGRATLRGGNIQSSPLKPREMAPIVSEDEDDLADDVEVASGLGEDEQDSVPSAEDGVRIVDGSTALSDSEANMTVSHLRSTTTNPDVIEKEQKIRDLQADLQALQEESRKLQAFGACLSKSSHTNLESLKEDFHLLLHNADRDDLVSNLPTDQNPLFQKHASSYLNVFADPALTMTYETWEESVAEHQKFVYQTTFIASKPWPPDTLNITLETRVDWGSDTVENVIMSSTTKQPELRKWFGSRREDLILKRDAATLLNGTRKFFEASIHRARIWKELVEPQIDGVGSDLQYDKVSSKYPVTSPKDAFSLLPYLFKTQHGFASPSTAQKQTRRSLGSARQLMLTYEISLDWLGQPEIKTDILLTGFNQETVEAAQHLYKQVEHTGGIVMALNAVKDILGMSDNAGATDLHQTGTMRTKKGKARRMTIFN